MAVFGDEMRSPIRIGRAVEVDTSELPIRVSLDILPEEEDSGGSEENNTVRTRNSKVWDERVENGGAALVWRDLTVTIKGKRSYSQKVLSTCTGYALPHSLLAIMGPPRSGKSTLLRALADLLPKHAKVYGEVLLNGHKRQLHYGSFAFIKKEDVFIETLTVREALYYSCLLQLPKHMSWTEKTNLINGILQTMELEDIADYRIGKTFFKRGISHGERRRLTVALKVLSQPPIIFVDEPIQSLDCVSAIMMMVTLKRLANDGRTVIITIQHISTEALSLISRLCLLANGKTIFYGETFACLEHFSNQGFPCPLLQNPSEHFIRALNPNFDKVIELRNNHQEFEAGNSMFKMRSTAIIQSLESAYNVSDYRAAVETTIDQISSKVHSKLRRKCPASRSKQILILTRRSFLHMRRCFHYYWLRLIFSIILTLSLGTLFYGQKHSFSSFQAKTSAIFFLMSLLCTVAISGFSALVMEMKVHDVENANSENRTDVFIIANFLSSIPYIFTISTICASIGHVLLDNYSEATSFLYFIAVFFLCLLISESIMMIVASLLPVDFEGAFAVLFFQVILMLVSGYLRPFAELPQFFWKYPFSYVSFYSYGFQGLLQNEYDESLSSGEEFEGFSVFSSIVNQKWLNLAILVVLSFIYRAILYITIVGGRKIRAH